MAKQREKGGGVVGQFVDGFVDSIGGIEVVSERTSELFLSASNKWDEAYSPKTATALLRVILGAFKDRDNNVYTEIGLDLSDPELADALKGFALEEIKTNEEFRLQLVQAAIEEDPNIIALALTVSGELEAIPSGSVIEGEFRETE